MPKGIAARAGRGLTLTVTDLRRYNGPPLIVFVGISTSGSGVHAAFPSWAALFAPGTVLRGVDIAEDAAPEQFRELVVAMSNNPSVEGAVITSHKLRLYRAIHDLIDVADPLVDLTREISALDTRYEVRAFARDPQSLDVVLDRLVQHEDAQAGRPIVCIGAGGSATALLLAAGLDVPASLAAAQPIPRTPQTRRGHLSIIGRDQDSLDELAEVRQRCRIDGGAVDLVLAADAFAVGEVVRGAPSRAIIANATGLGKTDPGSPLPDSPRFPPDALAWDFNYRGPLTFLTQARAAGVVTEDGWRYFVAGWSAALAALTGRELTARLLRSAVSVAEPFRPARDA
jgi:shikimate dehydrogenase